MIIKNKYIHSFTFQIFEVTSLFISEEMRAFATGSSDGTMNIYNLYNGVHMRHFYHPKFLPITNVIHFSLFNFPPKFKVVLSTSPLPCAIFYSQLDRTLYSYSINGQFINAVELQMTFMFSPLVLTDSIGVQLLVTNLLLP